MAVWNLRQIRDTEPITRTIGGKADDRKLAGACSI